MSVLESIGEFPWSRGSMIDDLEMFAELYAQRPLADNTGGMKAPHMFMAWFALRQLQPEVVVESGVYRGQGTWLIRQACPDAELYCIDLDLNQVEVRPDGATYFSDDFASLDWSHLPPEKTLLFFDDHQNAYERVKTARWFGFEHMIFEDNYPANVGDCYSLKKAFAGVGYEPEPPRSLAGKMAQGLANVSGGSPATGRVAANAADGAYLRRNLSLYCELPPVFKPERTRWGTTWADDAYPTPEPLLTEVNAPHQQVYLDEATDYTWICYARLQD